MNSYSNKGKVPARIVLTVSTLFAIAGCGGGDGSVNSIDPTVGGTRQSGNLVYSAKTTKRSFAAGETVPITFTVKNVGTTTVMGDNLNCYASDVRVTQDGASKWLYSAIPRGCGGGNYPFTIAPGATLTKEVDWDQTTNAGTAVAAGTYTVATWLYGFTTTTNDLVGNREEQTAYAPAFDIILTR